MITKRIIPLLLSLWLTTVAAGEAEQVAALYTEHCAVCHGENGDGKSRARFGLDPAPRDFTTVAAWEELTVERMRVSVTYGRPGSAMVAWNKRLSEQQIDALVSYIRSRFMHAPSKRQQHSGARLYKKHCAACHGDKGNGAQWTKNSLNPPPRDFTAAQSRSELSRERMITSVSYGRPGTAMMSFSKRLTPQQIEAVVGYVRSTFMKVDTGAASANAGDAPSTVAAADMSLAFPHGFIGDVARGRSFYMNNCFTCHGRRGDGNGPRASFINPKPRNFLAAASRRRLNRPVLYRAVSKGVAGTVMPAWGQVLNGQQIADVAEFVFETFIYPQKKKALNQPAL